MKKVNQYTSLSVRVWKEQMELIEDAARKASVSVAEYVRNRLMPVVAKELGIPLPVWPPLDRKGRPSVVREAAKLMGEDNFEKWKRELINEAAGKVIEKLGSGAPTPQPVRRTK